MDLETFLSFNWLALMPEFLILGVATIMTLLDLFLPKKISRTWLGWLGVAGVIAALVSLVTLINLPTTSILYDTFYLDSFAKSFKFVILLAGLFILVLAVGNAQSNRGGMEKYRSEYYYLLLAALLGGMIVTSSTDLITLFIGLELVSISSYILVSLKKFDSASNEGGLKYLLNGGIATAVTLFGFSYLYGLSGSTNLQTMSENIIANMNGESAYILLFSLILVVVGLSFKLATVPFHMWVPDVYEGSPTIVTAFLSVVSKTVGFAIFLRVMLGLFDGLPGVSGGSILASVQWVLILIAVVSMVVGNVMALFQKNIKRLFAFSSIAHAGYLFAAFTSLSSQVLETIWFYLVAYTFMNIGAFAVIYMLTRNEAEASIDHFAGLYRRKPILAVTMGIFLLSLASIPGTAGFIGKLKIIISALMVDQALYFLVASIIITTIISYFYYFRIMVQMFFRQAPAASDDGKGLKVGGVTTTVLTVCALGTIVLGLVPNVALELLVEIF